MIPKLKMEMLVIKNCEDERKDWKEKEIHQRMQKPQLKKFPQNQLNSNQFEYLVKYKGMSYMHLDWTKGSDLESLNKSAKAIYRRYLKKI